MNRCTNNTSHITQLVYSLVLDLHLFQECQFELEMEGIRNPTETEKRLVRRLVQAKLRHKQEMNEYKQEINEKIAIHEQDIRKISDLKTDKVRYK